MTKCVNDCGRDILPGSKLPDCQTCRSRFYRHKKKRPGQIVKMRKQYTVRQNGLDLHFNENGAKIDVPLIGDNVVPFKPRKRA